MLVSIGLTADMHYAWCAPAQTVSTRHNGPRVETGPTGPRPRYIAPRPRWDASVQAQDVEDFVQDETLVRLETKMS